MEIGVFEGSFLLIICSSTKNDPKIRLILPPFRQISAVPTPVWKKSHFFTGGSSARGEVNAFRSMICTHFVRNKDLKAQKYGLNPVERYQFDSILT